MLQVGTWRGGTHPLQNADESRFYFIGLSGHGRGDIRSAPDALPVLSKSMQVVLLPHTLEFASEVGALLEEVRRVLADGGQVVLLSHNPYSLRGLSPGWLRSSRSRGHGFSWTRNRLRGHGFAVSGVYRYGTRSPCLSGLSEQDRQSRVQYALRAFSEAYLVVARKRVIPMTLRRLPKRAPVAKPTALAREAVARRAGLSGSCDGYATSQCGSGNVVWRQDQYVRDAQRAGFGPDSGAEEVHGENALSTN